MKIDWQGGFEKVVDSRWNDKLVYHKWSAWSKVDGSDHIEVRCRDVYLAKWREELTLFFKDSEYEEYQEAMKKYANDLFYYQQNKDKDPSLTPPTQPTEPKAYKSEWVTVAGTYKLSELPKECQYRE